MGGGSIGSKRDALAVLSRFPKDVSIAVPLVVKWRGMTYERFQIARRGTVVLPTRRDALETTADRWHSRHRPLGMVRLGSKMSALCAKIEAKKVTGNSPALHVRDLSGASSLSLGDENLHASDRFPAPSQGALSQVPSCPSTLQSLAVEHRSIGQSRMYSAWRCSSTCRWELTARNRPVASMRPVLCESSARSRQEG